jgi:hypothetical protein
MDRGAAAKAAADAGHKGPAYGDTGREPKPEPR